MAVNGLPDAGKGTASGSLSSSVEAGKDGGGEEGEGGGRGKDGGDDLADAGAAGTISSVSSFAKDCTEAKRIWDAEKAASSTGTIS